MKPRSPRFILFVAALLLGLLAAGAWLLPGYKPNAVLHRLSYPQFILAVALGILCVAVGLLCLVPAARLRQTAFRAGGVLVGLVVGLLVMEIAIFLWPPRSPLDNPWYITETAGLAGSDVLPYCRPRYLKWTGPSRGDISIYADDDDEFVREVTFQTDYQGFRNSKDVRRADLVFVGDSFTEAGNVPEENTFVQLTSQRLGMTGRNLGLAGYGPLHELLVLEHFAFANQPKVVVWQFSESNDLQDVLGFQEWDQRGRPHYEPSGRSPVRDWQRRSPTYMLFEELKFAAPWQVSGVFVDRKGRSHEMRFQYLTRHVEFPDHDPLPDVHPGWPAMADAVRRGRNLVAQHDDARLVILLCPMKLRVMGPRTEFFPFTFNHLHKDWELKSEETVAAHLKELCNKLKIPFVNPLPQLKELADAGELVYYPFDTHFSDLGHEVVSQLLADAIEESLKNPPSETAPLEESRFINNAP